MDNSGLLHNACVKKRLIFTLVILVFPYIYPCMVRVSPCHEPVKLQSPMGYLHERVVTVDVIIADVVESAAMTTHPARIHTKRVAVFQGTCTIEVGTVGGNNIFRLILTDG